jgi:hypothetical protein
MDGRRGATRLDTGSRNKELHASRRSSKGVNALSMATDTLEMEDVNKRVGLRRFVRVDVDGII